MWRTCSPSELTASSYVQAATLHGDIGAFAKEARSEAIFASEDTGPIRVIHLVGPMRQPALLISHESGDPAQIEVRLMQRGTTREPIAWNDDLHGVLAVFGKSEKDCTWSSPALKDPP
jgi:hypothetical protein